MFPKLEKLEELVFTSFSGFSSFGLIDNSSKNLFLQAFNSFSNLFHNPISGRAGCPHHRPTRPLAMKTAKKPAGAKPKKAGTPDTRRDGRWLWVAVSCGHGKTLHTHENGLKRIAFTLLTHKDVAPNRKPRGLTPIKNVITKHIKKKLFLVFDG